MMTTWNSRPKELAPTGTSPLSALLSEKSRLKSRPRFVKGLLSRTRPNLVPRALFPGFAKLGKSALGTRLVKGKVFFFQFKKWDS